MKVIRAPLRVSLFGGGTDLDPFCSQYGSTIISFAINRYMYLTWNDRPTGGCRLSYSQVEELETLEDAEHTLVRETARTHGIDEPCTLTIVSDLPAGTGLGSSSALAVCLRRLVGPETENYTLVWQAGAIERVVSRAGWQDYLPAVYGGFHEYRIAASLPGPHTLGILICKPVPKALIHLINAYGLLLYTGASRPADSVLPSWQKSTAQLQEIKLLAEAVAERIDTITPHTLGHYLDLTWDLKRQIDGVSDPALNEQYGVAIANGAYGGKLCGAGAGGCWFFLVPPDCQERVREASGLCQIPFQIAEKGVEMWEL